ncbi:MAG: pyridoxal kinase [Cohaesibacteraceae bacterium]|nr:pyridoxal kinase [Cohaesibacteraceae bacterium]
MNQQIIKPPVLVISSHVAAGMVGNRALSFTLERMGHPVWEIPTVTMPWHPGHGPAKRFATDPDQFDSMLADLSSHPHLGALAGIISGYPGHKDQAKSLAQFITRAKQANPDLVYVCDPVIGDENGLYVPQDIAQTIRDILLPLADYMTPNRFELAWLTETQFENNSDIVDAVRHWPDKTVLVTSAFAMMRNSIANLMITPNRCLLAEHRLVPGVANGTGDLTSALFLANILSGLSDEKLLKTTISSVFEIAHRSASAGFRDLALATYQDRMVHPMAMVSIRSLETRDRS